MRLGVGARQHRGSVRGLTLLELLLVMGILGLAFGAGIGIFATRDPVAPIAPSVVRSALRNAQAAAQLEGAPVWVDWSEEDRSLRIRHRENLGTWHFEPDGALKARGERSEPARAALFEGARILGSPKGSKSIEPAWIGTGLDLRARRATWAVPLHTYERFDFTEGLSVSLMIHPTDAFDGVLWELGEIAGLEYGRDGSLSAWVTLRQEGDPSGVRGGGRVETTLPSRTAPVGDWTQVEVVYDRVELRVVVDGFPAAIVPLTDPLPVLQGSLVLGHRDRAFTGIVDSLTVGAYRESEPLELPAEGIWPDGAPTRIRFDADGTLDRQLHAEPIELRFETAPGQTESVRVSRYGTVE
ncbi:MAG: hypothetical protein ACYSWX_04090 [Planctomycetota bacterium]